MCDEKMNVITSEGQKKNNERTCGEQIFMGVEALMVKTEMIKRSKY